LFSVGEHIIIIELTISREEVMKNIVFFFVQLVV